MKTSKVLVLYGGISNEREVSLRSGAQVADHLEASGYTVTLADTAAADFDLAERVADQDLVIPMLHGVGGEDGTLQRALDGLGVLYFGSGADACALTFNKVATKELLAENGILTPNWEIVTREQFESSSLREGSYVLKPIAGGSTIDTVIVHNPGHQMYDSKVFDALFARYRRMLLEELIEGEEITVGVIGNEALPVILIVPPAGEEFDYDNKYNGHTREIAQPKQISASVQKQAQKLALRVHKLTGCRHVSRTDIIIAPNGALYVLEINTIPGMTAQSLVPNAAAAAGISMDELVRRFVGLVEK